MSVHSEFLDELSPSAIRNITGQIRSKAEEGIKIVNFAGGMPDEALFPTKELAQTAIEALQEEGGRALQYAASDGYTPLRKDIANLMKSFNVDTDYKNILITCGAQQALSYLTRSLVTSTDTIICENPTYVGALDTFRLQTSNIIGIDMDDEGIDLEKLESILKEKPIRFIYVIPDFQNPTGRTLSIPRRKQLVELANKYDTFIIEDAPYALITFDGKVAPAIKSFDRYDRVIYLGSFSKTICPGVRVGWINADLNTLQHLIYLKMRDDLQVSNMSQYQVHKYLTQYDFSGHLRDIRQVYNNRKTQMAGKIRETFPEGCKFIEPGGGIFLWVELPDKMDASKAFEKVFSQNIAFVPGTFFYPDRSGKNTLRLNFCTNSIETINAVIPEMGRLLGECERES